MQNTKKKETERWGYNMLKHNTVGKGEDERAVNGGLDKYYTKPFIADYYSNIVIERYGQDNTFVEPCAGNGSFLRLFENIRAYDLLPEKSGIIKMDVFDNTFEPSDIIVTNPPFGMNASLAQSIFNHIASFKVKAICYVAPRTFKKKSLQDKLDLNYHLVFEQDIIKNAFTVDGRNKDVPCVFQIWELKSKKRNKTENIKSEWLDFVQKGIEVDICVRRAGGKAGKVLDGTDHSESSTYFIKTKHPMVHKALQLIDLSVTDYTAGVKSISKQELMDEVDRIMEVLV